MSLFAAVESSIERNRTERCVIDCHFHLFRNDPNRNERYFALARKCGVRHVGAFLSGLDVTGAIADDPNREAIEARRRYGDMVLPFARVSASDGRRAVAELERLVRDEGFVGLKLSMNVSADDRRYRPIVEKCAELGIPILFHTFMGRRFYPERGPHNGMETDVLDLVRLARAVPRVRIIMSHYNLGDWEFGLKAVLDTPNIFPCTSGTGCDTGSIEMGVRECGAERLIFGSDSSLLTGLAKIDAAGIDDDDRRLILGENYRRLFPLPTAKAEAR